MKRALRITGAAACLFAVFLSVGGHWAVLQSIAWARMFADFSRTESLASAVEKTFDGRHPCAMCLKIREGRAQEKKPPPLLKWEKLPEFVPQVARLAVPLPPTARESAVPFIPTLHADFKFSPPKPPPRAV
jgi:hypothetical protein